MCYVHFDGNAKKKGNYMFVAFINRFGQCVKIKDYDISRFIEIIQCWIYIWNSVVILHHISRVKKIKWYDFPDAEGN